LSETDSDIEQERAMTKIVVLFNLLSDADAEKYEAWAKQTDLPTVNALDSVDAFDVLKVTGTFDGSASPYQYVEIIDVPDMEAFGADAGSETVQKVASEFRAFADNPVFMLTEALA
jgi:hypothetical protein